MTVAAADGGGKAVLTATVLHALLNLATASRLDTIGSGPLLVVQSLSDAEPKNTVPGKANPVPGKCTCRITTKVNNNGFTS